MRNLEYNYVKDIFEKEAYVLLSKTYENSKTKLKTLCPVGHVYFTSYDNFKNRGRRCNICGSIATGNSKRLAYKDVKEVIINANYTLISTEYKNVDQKLDLLCPEGHSISMNFHNFKAGWRCPICKGIRQTLLYSGENHSQWKGGLSLKGYCSIWKDAEYKEAIKQRDKYMCQNPYCYKEDKVLHIHHIDYDKQNCHPSNLITICRSCNSRANTDREWHKAWYQTIIKKYIHKEGFYVCGNN